MSEPRGWHSRGFLPHYDDGHAIQTITYRLADSLPAHVLAQLEELAFDDDKRRHAIEQYLDVGHGSCVLRHALNAEAVLNTWMHANGAQYWLHAWVVMPNHVHVIAEPIAGHAIGEIVGAWKSVSARTILARDASRESINSAGSAAAPGCNVTCSKKHHLWQADYFDRFIRNERHYHAAVEYIHQNPVKAGLVVKAEDWPWSSAIVWSNRNDS